MKEWCSSVDGEGTHREVIAHLAAVGGHTESAVIAGVGHFIQVSIIRFSEGYSIIVFTRNRSVITSTAAATTSIVDRPRQRRKERVIWRGVFGMR